MPFTAIEKILMKHSVDRLEKISPGDFVTAHIDYVGFHEGNEALTYQMFEAAGELKGVWDPEKVGMFLSHHFCTGHSDDLAANQKLSREWAKKFGIRVFNFGSGITSSKGRRRKESIRET
jgi:homoaconitase/3-isopropylmalate dehydratase large subunit